MKVICWLWLVEELPLLIELELLDGLSIVQGTATNLLPVVDIVEDPDVELEVVSEDEVPLVALESSCRTAKSTRPDFGLMITSLIVPMVVPELPWTCEPVS